MDNQIILIILSILIVWFTNVSNGLRKNLSQMNETLNQIAEKVGVIDTETENIDSELKVLIVDGKKIKAIKRYREHTRIGLLEAKEYVDRLSEKL